MGGGIWSGSLSSQSVMDTHPVSEAPSVLSGLPLPTQGGCEFPMTLLFQRPVLATMLPRAEKLCEAAGAVDLAL